MDNQTITIDVERLRDDLKNVCYGAFFGGGFGGALVESFDVDMAEPEELVRMAQLNGLNVWDYEA